MFGLGVPELIFILLLALLIFGPKKLPEIGRTLGKGMSEFRKASNELTRSINAELALDETPAPPPIATRADLRSLPRPAATPAAAQPAPPPAADPALAEAPAAESAELAPPPVEPS